MSGTTDNWLRLLKELNLSDPCGACSAMQPIRGKYKSWNVAGHSKSLLVSFMQIRISSVHSCLGKERAINCFNRREVFAVINQTRNLTLVGRESLI